MEAGDWIKTREIMRTISWTPENLEEKHGVRRIYEIIRLILLLTTAATNSRIVLLI